MPRLIRMMLAGFGDGAMAGLCTGEAILLTDAGRLHSLLAASPDGGSWTAVYFAMAALVFGTLGMSVAVLTLGHDDPR
jgi:hypothetical protein